MKDPNKVKRINLNVPLYLLKEIDEVAKKTNETRTDLLVQGAESILEEKKRKEKLKTFLSRKTPILDPKKYNEMYELGGTEWVKRLRQEGNR